MSKIEPMKKRDSILDIARAICIILMVMGHCSAPGTMYIYLFHMPLFFVFSGMCFSDKSYADKYSIISFVKRKILHLYVPFISINIFLVLIHNFLLKINIYTTNNDLMNFQHGCKYGIYEYFSNKDIISNIIQVLIFRHGEALAGPTWFLRVLFYITIVSCLIYYTLSKIKNINIKNIITTLCYILFSILGYYLYLIDFKLSGIIK